MATNDNLKDYLTALGNSFRYATNSTEKINAQDMLELPKTLGDSYKDLQKIISGTGYNVGDDLILPLGITKVRINAFNFGTDFYFNKIVIPEGVTAIQDNAMINCKSKEIHFPKTIKTIAATNAFPLYSKGYEGVAYFDSVDTFVKFISKQSGIWSGSNIKKQQFLNCNIDGNVYCNDEVLKNFTLTKNNCPAYLYNIKGWGMKGYFKIEDGSNLSFIYGLPFCDELFLPKGNYGMNLTFPSEYGPNPSKIYYAGTMTDYCSIDLATSSLFGSPNAEIYVNNEKLDKIIIPEGVVEIKQYSFHGFNVNYKEVIIPQSVVNIKNYSFYALNNASLGTKADNVIRLLSTTPPTIQSSTFSSYNGKFIVPASALNTYKTATNWSSRADKIFPDSNIEVSIDSSLLNNENILYSVDGGDKQQFTNTTLSLEGVGTLTIYNTSTDTIKLGKTNGGTDIGVSGSNTSITYTFTEDTTLYITKA